MLHNETGVLAERGEEAFALATTELHRDNAQREHLAFRGLELVQNFWIWTHAAERLDGHLRLAVRLGRA